MRNSALRAWSTRGLAWCVIPALLFALFVLPAPAQIHAATDWDRYMGAARSAIHRGDLPEADRQMKLAVEYAGRFEKDDYRLASTYTLLGELYEREQKNSEAERAYVRALELWKGVLGPDRAELTPHLYKLAAFYSAQGKTSAAEPLLQQCLKLNERAFDGKGMAVAESAEKLAELYAEQNKLRASEELYQRALKLKQDSLGRESPELAPTLRAYARLLRRAGRSTEAGDLEGRANSLQR